MDKEEILRKTEQYAKQQLLGESSGHDWWHTSRVLKTARLIAKEEKADLFIIELAVLLHDIYDWKLNKGNENLGSEKAAEFLGRLGVTEEIINHVSSILRDINFKGAAEPVVIIKTKEGKVVQDADRLDALGAVGIARTFTFSEKIGEEIYNPDIKVNKSSDFYKKKFTEGVKGTAINHFYEKLLLLKDRMNTKTGKKIAQSRHEFMEKYLEEFFKEWEGKA